MKKSRRKKIVKYLLITAGAPFILLWALAILLYIPSIQQYAVETLCAEISNSSGYATKIESARLSFPLKLKLNGFSMSRNDTMYIQGSAAGLNVSMLPLLKGEVELNYIELEQLKLNTREMLPDVAIKGEVGYLRVAARNVDLTKATANIRQIHLHSAHLDITITDTVPDEDDEADSLPQWVAGLRKGTIKESSLSLHIPGDSLMVAASIGQASIEHAHADIPHNNYTLRRLSLKNSSIKYDKGTQSNTPSPLAHIELNNISLGCSNIKLTDSYAKATIEELKFTQPRGISLTEAKATVLCDAASLEVERLLLRSKNGSKLNLSGTLPWEALTSNSSEELEASIEVTLNKKDLGALLTTEQYNALSPFDNSMLDAQSKLRGNLTLLNVDTLNITLPTLAKMSASGHLAKLYQPENLQATLNINAEADDIRKFIALASPGDTADTDTQKNRATDSNNEGHALIDGTIKYNAGQADANILLNATGGNIKAKALYNINHSTYNAQITADSLNISTIIPTLPLKRVSLRLDAQGEGLDIFSDSTHYSITLAVDTIQYGNIAAGNINIDARQANNLSQITAEGNDPNLNFTLNAKTNLHSNNINNTTTLHLKKADFSKLHITEANFATALRIDLNLMTDLSEKHSLKLNGKEAKIFTDIKTFTPKDIAIDLYTSPDSTSVHAANGDLKVAGGMDRGYNGLLKSMKLVGEMFVDALKHDNTVHYMQDYQQLLPRLSFSFNCGRDNMLANFLAMQGVTANNMRMNINMDTIAGLNIRGGIYGFKKDELNLDTIRVFTRQEGNKIRYFAGVRSTALNPQNEKQTYSASLYGNLTNDSLTTNFLFRNKADEIGGKIGAVTILKPNGLDISFIPEAILLNEKFTFNSGNYINIGKKLAIDADVTVNDEYGSGMHIYTSPDEEYTHNVNLSVFNVNLKKLTGVIPYAPNLAGILNLDLNAKNGNKGVLLSADLIAEELSYEGTYIGNEIVEAVYFPKGSDEHYLDLRLLHEEEEVVHLSGNYVTSEGGLDGELAVTNFPLSVSKAFMQDIGINLGGHINGSMSAKGKLNRLSTNGYIQFESANIDAYSFGANLHMPDETVKIEDNKLQFNDFDIFAQGNNPFKINGEIDFSTLLNPSFKLRMNASDYELINAPRKKGSMLYGKLFIDIRAMIGGTLDKMRLYGNVAMKSKSNITYVMLDAPIESDKELDGLVEFVNFNDTTAVAAKEREIDLGNINLNLNLTIDDGARINADLDATRHNYVTTEGSGNMHMTYTSENGINVTGHYAMRDGEFKLSLPVIPLKTLNISDGSEVRWTGQLLDPTLNVTALERVTSSVTFDDNSTTPVPFDVGVRVTNTLENMGLSFIMSSPENPVVQEQLNALDTESMNRYAVTMLLTGTYAGSSKNMTVSNALSTFIDAKINDIAGTAIKSVSVNVGINDATNIETGNNYKNYSFSFSKRFWNDRITLVVGGEVNSGDAPNSSNSFINNASLEWKISPTGNRYLKVFYDKNYESILEGEITETGIGYVYKRKLNRLKELFIFRNAKKEDKEQK